MATVEQGLSGREPPNIAEAIPSPNVLDTIGEVARHRFAGPALATALLVAGVRPTVHELFFAPAKPPATHEYVLSGPLFPGWIEAGIPAPLIQADRGHFHWMKDAIFTNPTMLNVTKQQYAYLQENLDIGNRLTLGDMLETAISNAQTALADEEVTFDPTTSQELEAVHVGIIAFAAACMPWFNKTELEDLGVDLERFDSAAAFYWGPDGIGLQVYPKTFGVENEAVDNAFAQAHSAPQYSGQDRTVHAAQHTLLAFEYLYSRHFGLSEHAAVPGIVRAELLIRHPASIAAEARMFSQVVGRNYELTAFKDIHNLPIPFIRHPNISEGPFDPMVEGDYKGNELGAEIGIAVFEALLANQSLQDLYTILKTDQFSRFEDQAVLPLS